MAQPNQPPQNLDAAPPDVDAALQRNRVALRVAILGSALLAALRLVDFTAPDFAIDDAWISFRIARNWLEHGVLTFDLSQPPVEGMTNLLWTLLSALWIRLYPQLDPVFVARAVGALLFVVTGAWTARLAARLAAEEEGGVPWLAAALAGTLVASAGWMAFHAMSGLETSLFAALFVIALDLAAGVRRPSGARPALCGLVLGLLAATRPEGVLAGGLVIAALAWIRRDARLLIAVGWPFAALVGALEGFRLYTYGALVPNTFHAKPPELSDGLIYLRAYWIYGLGIIGPLAALHAASRNKLARAMVFVGLVLGAGAIATGGDWMPGFRRLTVTSLAFIAAGAAGAAMGPVRWRFLSLAAVGAMTAGHIGMSLISADAALYPMAAMETVAHTANRSGIRSVALLDIGRFGYWFQGDIVDLAGLTDAHIARQPGAHLRKSWDANYFLKRNPELVLLLHSGAQPRCLEELNLRGPERAVLKSLRAEGGFRFHRMARILDDQYLLIYTRDGVSLSPEEWNVPGPELPECPSRPAAES